MSAPNSIKAPIIGAARLAIARPDWSEKFDFSADGFFRSFTAMALAAPLAAFASAADWRSLSMAAAQNASTPDIQAPGATGFVIASLIFTALGWAASLAALAFLSRWLEVGQRYAQLAIVFNWSRVVVFGVAAGVAALGFLDVAISPLTSAVALIANIWMVVYSWRIIRVTLQLRFGATTALLIILMLIDTILTVIRFQLTFPEFFRLLAEATA